MADIKTGCLNSNDLNCHREVKETQYKLVAHRCTHCGFDLSEQKRGDMFLCDNCGRLYKTKANNYLLQEFNIPRGKFADSKLFPFWMFHLRNTESSEKLKQALRLESDTIFIPAFEISNLKRAASMALSLSHEIDQIDFDRLENSEYNFNSVSLTSADASRMVIPFLFAGKNHLSDLNLDSLWSLYLEYDQTKLIWLPFYEEGHFYNGLLTGRGFEKAVLC